MLHGVVLAWSRMEPATSYCNRAWMLVLIHARGGAAAGLISWRLWYLGKSSVILHTCFKSSTRLRLSLWSHVLFLNSTF
jgi:hypothetical protein